MLPGRSDLLWGLDVSASAIVEGSSIDPSAVVETPPAVKAGAAFVIVLAIGSLLLVRCEGFVDRSVDAAMERPRTAVVYGLVAFGLLLFFGGYVVSQLAVLGGAGSLAVTGGVALIGVGIALLSGLGLLVTGSAVTAFQGRRRPWHGLVLGASLGAVGLLVLPLVAGAVMWVTLAAFGIGGPTHKWIHASRTVE